MRTFCKMPHSYMTVFCLGIFGHLGLHVAHHVAWEYKHASCYVNQLEMRYVPDLYAAAGTSPMVR